MWTNDGPNLYVTADQSTVVQENDPRARYLLVATGGQLPIADAERYGLTGGATNAAKSGDDVAASESEAKRKAESSANKLKQPTPPNKGKG
jgi:hypothetical protein